MSISLEGCWAKVQRADMHLDFLHQRVKSFVDDGGPYDLQTQPDSKTGEITIYGEVTGEPPTDEWGAIIGDVVHNLRSALDHLVWQLTIADGHTPPPNPIPKRGLGSEWRDIGVPICIKPYPTDHLRRLLSLNGSAADEQPVEVILLSRNDPDAGLRVFR